MSALHVLVMYMFYLTALCTISVAKMLTHVYLDNTQLTHDVIGRSSFNIQVFVTREKEGPDKKFPITYNKRPEMSEIMQCSEHDIKTLAFACGPEPMLNQVQALAVTNGITFHKETFEL